MSAKGILGAVLVIAGVALQVIPGIGTALGLGMIAAGISTASVIGLGLVVAGSLLMGPAKPKFDTALTEKQTDRLTATLIPTTPRKIVFGHTALDTDVRYQVFTGTNQEYLEMIVCHASHAVHSIDELWLDNELAWNGSVQGRYVGYLTVTTRTEGTNANGIAIDANWTVNSTLTGCAYTYLKFKLTGNTDKVSSPFASGVTSRMTFRGKGALVYDPRLDSTVDGGSGSHRADDQTTWAWDDDASRNPALQELFYELGWRINDKLAVGKGVPPARLDLASYAVAANACDESVALNGGGSEPRYCADGVVSEGDDPSGVRDNLCAAMNAVLRDAGGKLALTVIHNDLGSPVTPYGKSAFDEDDVMGEMQWDQTPDLNQCFNIVRGRRIDPSDNALYQPVDFPEVSLTSNDGIDRIDSIDYPFVQSNGQAQRLAKQRLERNQYQGRLTFTGAPTFWGLSVGDVFPLTHATFGWTEKLFRVAGQKISRSGETQIVAVEENEAIYQWDNDEAASVTPGTPTVYDPTNDPIIQGITDAQLAITGPASANVLYDNAGTTFQSGDDLAFAVQGSSGIVTSGVTITWTVMSGTFNAKSASDGAQSLTVTSGVATLTPTSMATDTASLQIDATADSISVAPLIVPATKVKAPAAPTGTGGGGAGPTDQASQSSAFTAINTASFTTITNTLAFTLPTGKTTLRCVINLSCKYGRFADQSGPWDVEFKIQRGGVDQGSTQHSSPDPELIADPDYGNISSPGTMQYTLDMTGLTALTQYSVVVQARVASGTLPSASNMSFTGTVTLSAP